MIIDFHTHLCDRDGVAQPFWDGWAEVSALRVNRPVERVQRRLPELWDVSGDMIVRDMDAAGIDKSVLLAIDWGLARYLGDLKLSSCSAPYRGGTEAPLLQVLPAHLCAGGSHGLS